LEHQWQNAGHLLRAGRASMAQIISTWRSSVSFFVLSLLLRYECLFVFRKQKLLRQERKSSKCAD
jgi:hypothetical protein